MAENGIFNDENRFREGAATGALGGIVVSAAVLVPAFHETGLNLGTGLEVIAFGALTVTTSGLGAAIGNCVRRKR